MAKKIKILIPVAFDGVAKILDENSYPDVDKAIEKANMPLCITFSANEGNITSGRQIYPDQFDGALTFLRNGKEIKVSAHGTFTWSWEGHDHFPLPANVLIQGVFDSRPTTHYFNEEEQDIDTGFVIEVPAATAPAKKAKAPAKKK